MLCFSRRTTGEDDGRGQYDQWGRQRDAVMFGPEPGKSSREMSGIKSSTCLVNNNSSVPASCFAPSTSTALYRYSPSTHQSIADDSRNVVSRWAGEWWLWW